MKERVETLETLCRNMNNDITALKALVKAVETRDYITNVTPITGTDGVVTGYTISFANSDPITINHGMDGDNGQDGQDGQDGEDGMTPIIGVRQDIDGVYYWTLNGDWLLDDEEQKIRASGDEDKEVKDGVTPQLKIEDDMWYVSYDNGDSWHELGPATGEQGPQGETGPQGPQGDKGESGDSMFESVDYSSSDYVIFTLSDGTQIKIPTWTAFEALQQECEKLNSNIQALQTMIEAIQENDYVTSITPIYEGNVEIGYIITFSQSGSITIYHGKDGQDGEDGKDGEDGETPFISVRQDTDGIYYWTLNGEWLLDDKGQKIKAVGEDGNDGEGSSSGSDGTNGKDGKDGVTPQLKIEEGKWYVSYDNGESWHELGQATGDPGTPGPEGEKGESFFNSVTQDEHYLYLVLADGTAITIPKATASPVTVTLGEVGETSVTFNGTVHKKSLDLKVTVYYSTSSNLSVYKNDGNCYRTEFNGDIFTLELTGLARETKYYYFVETIYNGTGIYSAVDSFTTIKDPYLGALSLSDYGTANSYIVSSSGAYSIMPFKGNSSESVGAVASVEVLWETFGTSTTPSKGDLIKSATYRDGKIYFKTADTFREGNAVIAAKDASGTILWSWHIWLTDQPAEHVYYNNAGTMMDRNLGATSATPGDVGALGLLYQWGRKDPFLGSSSISSNVEAKSTITWPEAVDLSSSDNTLKYSVENPTAFITYVINSNWYYTVDTGIDNDLWTSIESKKSVYDPCPIGWRVINGGDEGVWAKAFGSSSSVSLAYDKANEGVNFAGKLGSDINIWYPAAGDRMGASGKLVAVGLNGIYWSAYPRVNSNGMCAMFFYSYDNKPVEFGNSLRADAHSVRCIKEGTGGGIPDSGDSGNSDISTSSAVSLSSTGTANSYIVSISGTYSFSAVKGNSTTSVGSVSSVEVLWETFGTDVAPSVGDLIQAAIYENGKIYFKTADTYREGNVVIAAKDASGTILWSWHIWFTDQPKEHVYYNNAGTMMDRNLGATSATPGDVGALGLMYQWGRKDPFLGSASTTKDVKVASTTTWPEVVQSNASTGTIEYTIAHPTTYIKYVSGYNGDWYYTGDTSTDNTRWQSVKTIYDPCPVGWRVPDGGNDGIWAKAVGSESKFYVMFDYDKHGLNFNRKFGAYDTIWYPSAGSLEDGKIKWGDVGNYANYWSCTPNQSSPSTAHFLYFFHYGEVYNTYSTNHAYGCSVRCCRE